MPCPADVAALILEILSTAVLRVRTSAWSGDARRCAIEADYIHNLPHLLGNYTAELLRFYWEVERAAFIEQSSSAELGPFQPLWDQLARHVMGPAAHALEGNSHPQ